MVNTPTIPKDLMGFLSPDDPVAISFWIVSIAMVASTCFFLMESLSIKSAWKTSMNVGALVTLIAGVHYFYMREYWVKIHMSPIVYRYIDWSLTVPLQMIEFYLILAAVQPNLGSGMFFRLLFGTVGMLLFGYLGEVQVINPYVGFAWGLAGWAFILFEIFIGQGAKTVADASDAVKYSFNVMRFIVSIGWSIYPLGYYFGYLTGQVDDGVLNMIYNVADFINKIWFCLAIWQAARKETLAERGDLKTALLA
jgi:bacteriorhodopsin